jgi:hypothetical protein
MKIAKPGLVGLGFYGWDLRGSDKTCGNQILDQQIWLKLVHTALHTEGSGMVLRNCCYASIVRWSLSEPFGHVTRHSDLSRNTETPLPPRKCRTGYDLSFCYVCQDQVFIWRFTYVDTCLSKIISWGVGGICNSNTQKTCFCSCPHSAIIFLTSSIHMSDIIEHASRRMPAQTTLQCMHVRFNNVNCAHTFPSFHSCYALKNFSSMQCDHEPPVPKTWFATGSLKTCFRCHKPARAIWRRTEPPVAKVLHY